MWSLLPRGQSQATPPSVFLDQSGLTQHTREARVRPTCNSPQTLKRNSTGVPHFDHLLHSAPHMMLMQHSPLALRSGSNGTVL